LKNNELQTQIVNSARAELVLCCKCNKSKCIQIQVHFHSAPTLTSLL